MGNEFHLLYWFWWRARISVMLIIGSVLIAQIAFWFFSDTMPKPIVGLLLGVSVFASFINTIAVFSGDNLDLTSGRSGLPSWWLSLPLSNFKLAMVPVVTMLVAVTWCWIPFSIAVMSLRGGGELTFFEMVLMPWLGMCAFGVGLQGFSWRPFKTGWHRLGAMVIGVFVVAGAAMFVSTMQNVGVFLLGGLVCAAICFAFAGVAQARNHGWRALITQSDTGEATIEPSESAAQNYSLSNFKQKLNLKDAWSALLWRDWHQIGRVVVLLMSFIAVPAAVLILASMLIEGSGASATSILMMLAVPVWLCASISPTLGKNEYFKGKFPLSPHLAALPVSDNTIWKTRIRLVFTTSICCWLLAMAVIGVWMLIPDNWNAMQSLVASFSQRFPNQFFQSGWALLIGMMLFGLYVTIAGSFPGLALGLCGRKKFELWVVGVVSVFVVLVILGVCYYGIKVFELLNSVEKRSEYFEAMLDWVPLALAGVLVAKITVTAIGFWLAAKRVTIHQPTVIRYASGTVVICSLLIAMFCLLIPSTLIPTAYTAAIVVLLFPFASLALSRAALDWNRHR